MKNAYPPETRAVFMTNVNQSGDDVMIFTSLTASEIQSAYRRTTVTFGECYEVPERDVGYYIYEPCWLTVKEEQRARQLIANEQSQSQS